MCKKKIYLEILDPGLWRRVRDPGYCQHHLYHLQVAEDGGVLAGVAHLHRLDTQPARLTGWLQGVAAAARADGRAARTLPGRRAGVATPALSLEDGGVADNHVQDGGGVTGHSLLEALLPHSAKEKI